MTDTGLHVLGGALAGLLVAGALLAYGQRHLTARHIRHLENTGRTEEAAAHRAVLYAQAQLHRIPGTGVSAACHPEGRS